MMLRNLWTKILAVLSAILAFFAGLFAILLQREKNKQVKEKLKENEEELKRTQEGEKANAQYKKETEQLVLDAIRRDDHSILDLMQNNSETGAKRNNH